MTDTGAMLQFIATITIKSSVILAAALLVVRGSKRMSESTRYRLALVALAGLVIVSVPVGEIVTGISVPVFSPAATPAPRASVRFVTAQDKPTNTTQEKATPVQETAAANRTVASSPPPAVARNFDVTRIAATGIIALYLAGILAGLIRLGIAALRLKRYLGQSIRISPPPRIIPLIPGKRRYRRLMFYLHPGAETPFSCGIFRPAIVLPPSTVNSDRDLEYITAHELTHIRRNDNLILLVLRTFGLIHWFNPLFHVFRRQVESIMETSCDETVVNRLGSASDYCETLMKFIRPPHPAISPTTAMSSRAGMTSIRFRKLHAAATVRPRPGYFRIALLSLLAVLLAPVVGGKPAPIETVQYEGYIAIPTARTQMHKPTVDTADGSVHSPQRPGDDLIDLAEFTAETGTPYFLAVNDNPYEIDGIELNIEAAESVATIHYAVLSDGNRYAPDYAEWKQRLDDSGGFSFNVVPIDASITIGLSLTSVEADFIDVSARITLSKALTPEESRQYTADILRYLEYKASQSIEDRVIYDFARMERQVHASYMHQVALATRARDMLDEILLPDPYSQTSEPYGFEAGSSYYVFSSVGPDDESGTADDPVWLFIDLPGNASWTGNGRRAELWKPEIGWLKLNTYGIDPGTRQ